MVSDYIRAMILRQVNEHGVVVWFDPEHDYQSVAESLDLPEVHVAALDGSFFDLRYRVRSLMGREERPLLVIYVPEREEDTAGALVEFTVAGSVMKPGASSSSRNTRLAVVARKALSSAMTPPDLERIIHDVEAGRLKLGSLDKAGAKKAPILLSEIFGAPDEDGIILTFLSAEALDANLLERGGGSDLARLAAAAVGADWAWQGDPKGLRRLLQRTLLVTDLSASLAGGLPESLASVGVAPDGLAREQALQLAERWRDTHGLRDSYMDAAQTVERELDTARILEPLAIDVLGDAVTFPCIDRILQRKLDRILAKDELSPDRSAELGALLASRMDDVWSRAPDRFPDIGPMWHLEAAILDVLTLADIPSASPFPAEFSPDSMIQAYTAEGGQYTLDEAQRRLEEVWHRTEMEGGDESRPDLREALFQARGRHAAIGGQRAELFVRCLTSHGFAAPKTLRQRDIWRTRVKPALDAGKVGYVLVDALRFEMGVELAAALRSSVGPTEIEPALAVLPTLTPVGMAALLPGTDGDFEIVSAGKSKLGTRIDGQKLTTREERMGFLSQRCEGVVTAALPDLLPHPTAALDKRLKEAACIVVTSQDIDELCETGMTRLARLVMETLIADLARLAKKLAHYGCETIVIASDHGHLFGEEAGSDMKIPPPGGETLDLNRRMWAGRGGAKDERFFRGPLAATGVDADFDIAVPWALGIFEAVGGGTAFFHGGMSQQEAIIPVLTVHPKPLADEPVSAGLAWRLSMSTKRVTTLFVTVTVEGSESGLFGIEPQLVRLEVLENGKVVGRPVAAQYGYDGATGDVTMSARPDNHHEVEKNTVTLQLDRKPDSEHVAIRMLDPATGRELARLDGVPVEMLSL